eukprot:COSAG04_NODE_6918_length_1229_cov_1.588496_1_plen_121_part_00
MGKPPKPLEPLINALSALNTDTYVLALKSAALHLQVRLFPSLQRSRLAPASWADADAGAARLRAQGRDADIDPVELKGKLSACDLGGSTIAQVRLQTFSLGAAFSASRPLPASARQGSTL